MASGFRFEFRSITTLDSATRRYIWDKMTWDDGSMRIWLSNRRPRRRLCLIYNHRLITWACLGLGNPHDISAWTLLKYRGRGFALAAMWALLNQEKITRRRQLSTYSSVTRRIVRRLGYTAK